MAKSYVMAAGLDLYDDITEARLVARLTVAQCIDLCDCTERTWYRWMQDGAPRWAIRLVMSQRGTLDHLGWKDWEIDGGCLYHRQLSYRYYWTPTRLLLPLYNVTASDIAYRAHADNLSSIETARDARKTDKTPENTVSRRSG